MNISKNQRRAISMLPKEWFTVDEATIANVDLRTLHGLQSKGLLQYRGVGLEKEYFITR
jgi:hypothetical protein